RRDDCRRRLRVDPSGARGARTGRRGPVGPRDRRQPVPEPSDGLRARPPHPRQTGHADPDRRDRPRPAHRPDL
ncbi:MAG: hypothetical protein AVDCRST_MAG33-2852, partial [uncultured Thermomicrobiales bacterium]